MDGSQRMSQTDTHSATVLARPAPAAAVPASVLWLAAGVRFLLAALGAAVIVAAVAIHLSTRLSVRTDIVGYPTHQDYDISLAFDLYYLLVVVYPVSVLVLYLALTWAARKLRFRGSDRAPALLPAAGSPHDGSQPAGRGRLVASSRLLAVGAGLGVEAAFVLDRGGAWFWLTVAAVALVYSAAIAGLGLVLPDPLRRGLSPSSRIASLNALVVPLGILGLLWVSSVTTVTVASDHSVHRYPWLPWWLGIVAAGLLLGLVGARLARARSDADVNGIEGRVILLVLGSVVLFLALSTLPAGQALGPISIYEDGQNLAATRLTLLQGYVPWRDVLPEHGLLQDQLASGLGWFAFASSLWGARAGRTIVLIPLAYVFLYLFAAALGRRWALAAALAAVIAGGPFTSQLDSVSSPMRLLTPMVDIRFMFWPLVLALMGAALERDRWWLSALLGVALVAQAIVTPEAAFCLAAVGGVVLLRDVTSRDPDRPLVARFSRTLWITAGGALLGAAFVGLLLVEGALRSFILYFLVYAQGHELQGGLPLQFATWDPAFWYAAVCPLVAILLSTWYLVGSALRRRRLDAIDWVMAAATIFALLYYPKFLARADGHVYESYSAAVPLLVLVLYRGYEALERALSSVRPGAWLGHRVTPQPVAAALLAVAVIGTAGPLSSRLAAGPGGLRATAATEPAVHGLGYSIGGVDPATEADLDAVLSAYLRPGDWVFDFSNAPALYYYLLDRNPHTRYFNVSLAMTEVAQKDLIAELQRDRPRLVVFNSNRYGLSEWDYIPNMVRHYDVSQYILDHYQPLLSIQGQVLYADASANLSASVAAGLPLREAPVTADLPFRGQSCDWGTAPDFLAVSPPARGNDPAPVTLASSPAGGDLALSGWAGDAQTGGPAREIVFTADDRVVARVVPNVARPDVAAYLGKPGLARSGYSLDFPTSYGGAIQPRLRVFGISDSGVASELTYLTGLDPAVADLRPPVTHLDLGQGQVVPVRPGAVTGFVGSLADRRYQLQLVPPAGTTWAAYRWLEIDARSDLGPDAWAVSDGRSVQPQREVTFRTLDGGSSQLRVYIGSCAQWHGYGNVPLYLSHGLPAAITAIRLLP
jgi:hypothetical protein